MKAKDKIKWVMMITEGTKEPEEMAGHSESNSFEIHLFNPQEHGNIAPIDLLIRTLNGLQQTALLIGASQQKSVVPKKRFRPSEELLRSCELFCGPLREGSVKVEISSVETQKSLPGFEVKNIAAQLVTLLAAIGSSDQESLNKILPDSSFREKALRQTLSYLPATGSTWEIDVQYQGLKKIKLNSKTRHQVQNWFAESNKNTRSIIARLSSLDFTNRKVSVEIPIRNKRISFSYDISSEDILISKRRDWVQVWGEFTVDDKNEIKKANDVWNVQPLDLSSMIFKTVECGDFSLEIAPALEIIPQCNPEEFQGFTAEYEPWNLFVTGETREDLEKEIIESILFLWNTYAEQYPEKLTSSAQDFQNLLRKQMRLKNAP